MLMIIWRYKGHFRLSICKDLINFNLKQWNCSQFSEVSEFKQIKSVNSIIQANLVKLSNFKIVHLALMEVYFVWNKWSVHPLRWIYIVSPTCSLKPQDYHNRIGDCVTLSPPLILRNSRTRRVLFNVVKLSIFKIDCFTMFGSWWQNNLT